MSTQPNTKQQTPFSAGLGTKKPINQLTPGQPLVASKEPTAYETNVGKPSNPTTFRWTAIPSEPIVAIEVIGEPDIGKTFFCTRACGETDKSGKIVKHHSALGDTENKGRISMSQIGNPYLKEILTFQDFRDFVSECIRNPEIKVCCVDSGSDMRQMAEEEFCKENDLKRVYPIVLFGRVFIKIDYQIMQLFQAKKHFISTSRIRDEFEDDVRTGRKIRDSYKKLPYQLPLMIVLQRGIRDARGKVWFENHVFAEIFKDNFWKRFKEKPTDRIGKPWLFDCSFEGVLEEIVKHPWNEEDIIASAHQYLHDQGIIHDEKDTDKLPKLNKRWNEY
jgi:hypothetical protein